MKKPLNIIISKNQAFDLAGEYVDKIKCIAPDANIIVSDYADLTEDMIKNADIFFGWPPERGLKKAENLKWIQLPSAGADGYTDRRLYYRGDTVLTNSSGVFSQPIAEHVIGMILAFYRNISLYIDRKKYKSWDRFDARDFYGSTVGIVGLGSIGSEVAKRSRALGAKVLAFKRTYAEKPDYVDELMYGDEGLDKLLELSDSVVLALPNTNKTKGILSEGRLRMMKKNAFIVNIGRGALIDQDALIRALKEKWISGAGLDVTSPEPLLKDSPLWDMPNVIITPHASGSSPTNIKRQFDIFYKNLTLYIEGKPLENQVDFNEGY